MALPVIKYVDKLARDRVSIKIIAAFNDEEDAFQCSFSL